jgi:outer membrane immunogenic protein
MGDVMKKLAAGCVAVAAAFSAPALAADMPAKVPAYRAPYSWTGCHAGFNFGLFIPLDRYDNAPSGAFVPALGPVGVAANTTTYTEQANAYTFGAQAGCDVQWGVTVWGVAADFNGTGVNENVLGTPPANAFLPVNTESVSKKIPWFSTFRGRFGITPGEAFLIYGTGGLAVANLRAEYASQFTDGTTFAGAASTTRTGWTAGGGVEWGVAPGWTVNFEYLYLDFGSFAFISPNTSFAGGPAAPAFTWTTNVRAHEQTFRVGINYWFGGPVAARY